MGIKILDTIELNTSGISLANCYSSFCVNDITICKRVVDASTTHFIVESTAQIWKDYDTRCNGKTPIGYTHVTTILTLAQLDTNIYTHLYTALKAKYTSTEDL